MKEIHDMLSKVGTWIYLAWLRMLRPGYRRLAYHVILLDDRGCRSETRYHAPGFERELNRYHLDREYKTDVIAKKGTYRRRDPRLSLFRLCYAMELSVCVSGRKRTENVQGMRPGEQPSGPRLPSSAAERKEPSAERIRLDPETLSGAASEYAKTQQILSDLF